MLNKFKRYFLEREKKIEYGRKDLSAKESIAQHTLTRVKLEGKNGTCGECEFV
jgi:hypothetical protein